MSPCPTIRMPSKDRRAAQLPERPSSAGSSSTLRRQAFRRVRSARALRTNTRRSRSFPCDAPVRSRGHPVGTTIDAKLPGKGHAFLSPRLFVARRFYRQLQHGSLLPFAQEGQKKSSPVRQFERIMVHMRLVTIDVAKNCRLVPSGGGSAIDCDFRIKRKLRAGKHADRGAGVARSSESARAGAEITRSKLIANARGTRFDVHQAIVAHGIGSSVPHLLRLTR